jgi:dTMP kinase
MKLLVLEGLDGAGTTTQTARLAESLRAEGRAVHVTREPSDGPVGHLLRSLLAGAHAPVDATTMALLFAADRADHLAREIEPELARGAIVISDRYYHSSLAYQGAGEDRAWIDVLNRRARRPDLTLFLEIEPTLGEARRRSAGRADELYDRLETQERVAANYREVIAARRARGETIAVLDGGQPVEAVAARVLARARETLA